MKLVLPKVKAKDLIKPDKWLFYPGDTVRVIQGPAKNLGKEGKIIDVVKNMNSVIVDNVNMAKKHVRPNPMAPRGSIISKPMPIHYSNVKLIDPTTNLPTDAQLIKVYDKALKMMTWKRLLTSGQLLPTPLPKLPMPLYEESHMDTPKELITAKTFRPDVFGESPFPARFMNQLERARRHNKESHVC